jgi:hypothetical protein
VRGRTNPQDDSDSKEGGLLVASGARLFGERVSGPLLNFPEAKSCVQQAHLRFHITRPELIFVGSALHFGEFILRLAACPCFH